MDDNIQDKKQYTSFSCLLNEKLNFQIAYTMTSDTLKDKSPCYFHIKSELKEFIRVYKVESVAVRLPVYHNLPTDNYQRKVPHCYPDLLCPYDKKDNVYFVPDLLQSLFIEVDLSNNTCFYGDYVIKCYFTDNDGNTVASTNVSVNIINSMLSDKELHLHSGFTVTV